MADNLQDAIKQTLADVPIRARLSRHHLIIANQDGICLFSNRDDKNNISVGALLGGVWQASKALVEVSSLASRQEIKLGFDDGENGFCVVAFELATRPCYACLIFKNDIAPGALRGQLRHWCDELAASLIDWKPPVSRSGYLFKDVTDEEIDRLFGFGGSECRS